jgi:nucleolar protein 12
MSYKPGSISSFLGGASDGDQGTLSNLFSHESLQKFARVIKPEEIATVKKVAVNTTVEGESDETAVKKKKKPKTRNRKPQGSESADINNTSGSAETSENSSSLKTETEPDGEASRDHRTVFIGNIPTSETVKSIKKLCQEFGEVESVRLRSVPVAGTAVDEAGNQDLVRKVCANSREFSDTKGSFNAYVVFKKVESVSSALTANNRLVGKRHLRIDKANPTLFDPKLSVFIGALPHYTDEEHLRGHFAAVSASQILLESTIQHTAYSHYFPLNRRHLLPLVCDWSVLYVMYLSCTVGITERTRRYREYSFDP